MTLKQQVLLNYKQSNKTCIVIRDQDFTTQTHSRGDSNTSFYSIPDGNGNDFDRNSNDTDIQIVHKNSSKNSIDFYDQYEK